MNETVELLRAYSKTGSERAFRELVERHVDLVYSTALRKVAGDSHLAQDIAQTVFCDLARKAPALPPGVILAGWLYRHTCLKSAETIRGERRRNAREQIAAEMNLLNSSDDRLWRDVGPALDDAMENLNSDDRDALVLRFFQDQDLRRVGSALGIGEDAAQKRVSRALERLRELLAKRGVTSAASALGIVLAANTLTAAPAGLAANATSAALAGLVAGAGFTTTFLKLMNSIPMKLVLAAVLGTVLITAVVSHKRSAAKISLASNSTTASTATSDAAGPDATAGAASGANAAAADPANSDALRLTILAADTSKPLSGVDAELRGWQGTKFYKATFRSRRDGICAVTFPRATTTQFQLTTRLEGFADTRLSWRTDRGEIIPTNYTVRLEQPVPISGRVIDADGQPVAGAKVGFNDEQDPQTETLIESHRFGWIEVETDAAGHWQINRIAADMLRSIYGGARHPEYVDPQMIFTSREHEAERQMREGTHIFQLGKGLSLRGNVVDADDQIVPDAKVFVGGESDSARRNADMQADGSFIVKGCKPGREMITAEAPGFAATTLGVDITETTAPVKLVLQHGKLLRLRVVNKAGQPVPGAGVSLNIMNSGPCDPNNPPSPLVQTDFSAQTDAEGRVQWDRAPDRELAFDFGAISYMRVDGFKARPDGEEHVVTLPPALTVAGTVRDATTGQLIPRFRIGTGSPSTDFRTGKTNAQFSTIGRFWMAFEGGQFRTSYEEAVITGMANPGYILKFDAEGYSPFVSRVIGADEGEVQMEIALKPAALQTITVLQPDGNPAVDADVGLVMPGSQLNLVPGGFSREMVQSGGSLLRTDDRGRFRLTADDSVSRVMIAHSSGFAEMTPDALAASPKVQLQSWGRIEGTLLSGGKAAANGIIRFNLGNGDWNTVRTDFTAYQTQSDAEGGFVFAQVPPGRHKLMRTTPQREAGGVTSWHDGAKVDIEVRPGETTTVTLGGNSYSVTAQIRWPSGLKREANHRLFASIHTPMPQMPAGIEGNQEAMARWAQSPEIQALAKDAKNFPAAIAANDELTCGEVTAGQYVLSVMVMAETTEPRGITQVATGEVAVTIPADPPSGGLELGEIVLRKFEPPTTASARSDTE
jgi:RNA polymerase sigma factor (sigma-70 family)